MRSNTVQECEWNLKSVWFRCSLLHAVIIVYSFLLAFGRESKIFFCSLTFPLKTGNPEIRVVIRGVYRDRLYSSRQERELLVIFERTMCEKVALAGLLYCWEYSYKSFCVLCVTYIVYVYIYNDRVGVALVKLALALGLEIGEVMYRGEGRKE